MPRNSSGTYTLPSGNPVVTGTTITSTWANATMTDLGAEITNSLDRNGRGGMLAPFKVADGSAAAPGVSFSNEPSTGWYRSASGEASMSVLGTQVIKSTNSMTTINNLTVTNNTTFSGLVGVGGTAGLYAAAGRGELDIQGSNTAFLGLGISGTPKGYLGASASLLEIGVASGNSLSINMGGTAQATLDAGGNMGLGSTPLLTAVNRKVFSVNGTLNSVVGFGVAGAAVASVYADTNLLAVNSNGVVTINPGNVEKVRFQGLGATIGGTNTPTARLDIRAVGAGENWVTFYDTGNSLYGAIGIPGAGGKFSIQSPNVPLSLSAGGAEAIVISTSQVATYGGFEIGFRDIPRTVATLERGKVFVTSAGFTLNTGLATGSAYSVWNNSNSSITVTRGGGLILRLLGTALDGNRTIGPYGWANIWVNSSGEYVMSGPGVS